MLSIARSTLRPAFARRSLAGTARLASIHTVPDLPYAYNVSSSVHSTDRR